MNKKIMLGIALAFILGSAGWFYLQFMPVKTSSRPTYCMEGKCVGEGIFKELPKYPENFKEVWSLFNPEPYLGMMEDFSVKYPDENYWKQPEFYSDSFTSQGLKYYTTSDVRFAAGSGPYPGDVYVSNITKNDTIPVSTYWHASWAIPKYQLFKLVAEFPESGKSRMGEIVASQNPNTAEECIDVSVEPKNILLEPTWPHFYEGWTQKVTSYITPKCSGMWLVSLIPGNPDADVERQMIKEHGLYSISTIRLGGAWQIFLSVN